MILHIARPRPHPLVAPLPSTPAAARSQSMWSGMNRLPSKHTERNLCVWAKVSHQRTATTERKIGNTKNAKNCFGFYVFLCRCAAAAAADGVQRICRAHAFIRSNADLKIMKIAFHICFAARHMFPNSFLITFWNYFPNEKSRSISILMLATWCCRAQRVEVIVTDHFVRTWCFTALHSFFNQIMYLPFFLWNIQRRRNFSVALMSGSGRGLSWIHGFMAKKQFRFD